VNEQITEIVNSSRAHLRVDREAGVVRGVKILGLTSKNNRTYAPQALARAIPLYEGARVNVNHPQGRADAPRDYQDRIGTVRNVEQRDDGLYGDFYFNPKHAVAEQLAWDAQHAPENVGFSHNALARTTIKDGRTVVEEIVQVRSVDLVADPATTRGLFEHHLRSASTAARIWDNRSQSWKPFDTSPTKEEESMPLTLESLKHEYPELYEEVRSTAIRECEQSVMEGHSRELERLQEENESLLAEKRAGEFRRAILTMLDEACIPAALRTERFEQICLAAPDVETVAEFIQLRLDDRGWLDDAAKPRSMEQTPVAAGIAVHDGATFAAALR